MYVNLYQLNLSPVFEIIKKDPNQIPRDISSRLSLIENEIIKEYEIKQEGKIGIRTLGNEIRYNSNLKEEFSRLKNGKTIIKLTENRRSFIKVFLDNWIEHKEDEIFFLILEDHFGITSNLVDSSFIRIEEITDELDVFFRNFEKRNKGPKIYFIEIKGFSGYNINRVDDYSKIYNINTDE